MTTIIVTHEDQAIDEFAFDTNQMLIGIGRRSTNDVCIPNLSVSGIHAQITFEGGKAWIEDLNSTNGTFINGASIRRQALNDGDEVIIGKTHVRFLIDDASTIAQSAPANSYSEEPATEIADSYVASRLDDDDDVLRDDSLIDDSEARLRAAVDTSSGQNLSRNGAGTDYFRNSGSSHGAEASHPLDEVEHDAMQRPTHELDLPGRHQGSAVIEIKNGAKSGQILPIDKPVTTLGRPGIQIAAIMRKPDGYYLMHVESDQNVSRPTINASAIGDEPVGLTSGDALNVAGIDVEFMLS